MLEFTPEPLSVLITAFAALVVAFGGRALKQGYDSGKSANPEDKMRVAIEANTASINAMMDQFRHNNSLFVAMGNKVDQMNNHMQTSNQTLGSIHTEMVRGSARASGRRS